ncbi:MAG: type II secretion system F family protein [Candidatus Peribacteraceae bacterium]|nr:type II secretion system F family protein [Candidatus Peribacteraceae bacterium]
MPKKGKRNSNQSRQAHKNLLTLVLSFLHLGEEKPKHAQHKARRQPTTKPKAKPKKRTQRLAAHAVAVQKADKADKQQKKQISAPPLYGKSVVERHKERLSGVAEEPLQRDPDKHGVFEERMHLDWLLEPEPKEEQIQPIQPILQDESPKIVPKEKQGKAADGLDLEFTADAEPDAKQESADEEHLREQVAEEGFLESAAEPKGKAAVGKGHTFLSWFTKEQKGEITSAKPLSEKEQKAQAKKEAKRLKEKAAQEKKEEKKWREEAERRSKILEERDAKEKAEKKPETRGQKDIEWKMPKPKKQNAFQRFFSALGYMGLDRERTALIDNLGTMMGAGLSLLEALRVLEREMRKRPMRKLIGRIVVAVEMGSPLWRAMEGQYFFKQQQIAMIRVGEEAGSLVENLHYLSQQEERDHALRSKVKTAMIYPAIVLVMMTGIVFGLGFFVLPNLVGVLTSLGVPLPLITRMIIKGTQIFVTSGVTIITSFVAGILVLVLLTKYTPFKILVQWVIYHIPGIGKLLKEATLSRFGVVVGGLLQAGVPVTEALESLVNATSLARYRSFYAELLEHVKLGDSFATSFESIKATDKCFPASMQQLVITGEQSGSLTKIMLKIADIHDKEASDIAEKLPVIIEPLLLLFIGGLVATIAIGVLGPIYSVVGNVGGA